MTADGEPAAELAGVRGFARFQFGPYRNSLFLQLYSLAALACFLLLPLLSGGHAAAEYGSALAGGRAALDQTVSWFFPSMFAGSLGILALVFGSSFLPGGQDDHRRDPADTRVRVGNAFALIGLFLGFATSCYTVLVVAAAVAAGRGFVILVPVGMMTAFVICIAAVTSNVGWSVVSSAQLGKAQRRLAFLTKSTRGIRKNTTARWVLVLTGIVQLVLVAQVVAVPISLAAGHDTPGVRLGTWLLATVVGSVLALNSAIAPAVFAFCTLAWAGPSRTVLAVCALAVSAGWIALYVVKVFESPSVPTINALLCVLVASALTLTAGLPTADRQWWWLPGGLIRFQIRTQLGALARSKANAIRRVRSILRDTR